MRPSLFFSLLLIPAVALAIKDPPVDDEHWSKKYDGMFRKYSKHYFGPHVNWKWFKSQAIAESNLKPAARSPTGAVGIMQILPSTAAYDHVRIEDVADDPVLLAGGDASADRAFPAAALHPDRFLCTLADQVVRDDQPVAVVLVNAVGFAVPDDVVVDHVVVL